MIEKVLLQSQRDFDNNRKNSWRNSQYVKFHVLSVPDTYPCVAIVISREQEAGSLGSEYIVDQYVYPMDFVPININHDNRVVNASDVWECNKTGKLVVKK